MGFVNSMKDLLDKRDIRGEESIKAYIVCNVAAILCLVIHFMHLLAFTLNGIYMYTALNLLSVTVYSAMLLACDAKKYTLAALMLTFEICFYAFIVSVTSGVDSYILSYYFLVFMMQVVIPYGTRKLRMAVMMVVMSILMTNIIVSLAFDGTITYMGDKLYKGFMSSNIVLISLGIVICLYVGDMIQMFITRLNHLRISELMNMASRDQLTGVFNRRHADKILEEFTGIATCNWCVALLDIDKFKSVNDTYGHDVGDAVLIKLAKFMTGNLRSSDYVFRWGGEEFLILLSNVSLKGGVDIMNKLREKFAKEVVEIGNNSISVTFSCGVAKLDKDDVKGSIKTSDNRLYYGKEHGRNIVIGEDFHQ